MLISPLPGSDRRNIRQALNHVWTEAVNARSTITEHDELCLKYLSWAVEAATHLRSQISARDLDRLVLTRRYWALQQVISTAPHLHGRQAVHIAQLVRMELEERATDLQQAMDTFHDHVQRWSDLAVYVVADTSFFVQHTERLEEADFAPLIEARDYHDIHLLFPMVVVDELDNLKQHGKQHTRWRAGHTLAVLDRVLASSVWGVFREREAWFGKNRQETRRITMEIVLDPAGHTRLPIADDEIIDRAKAIEALAARPVTLLTYDTSQATRGRSADLRVVKLQLQLASEEPPRS
ncbi:PIN domain-containing protein [Nonomuraea sp. NPDC050790]|uniref:PIN domain-containing protein n=1 Tax=Nonomuraea sp. NPDC050790 TaxID=3364371 RepID=UPI0037BD28A7